MKRVILYFFIASVLLGSFLPSSRLNAQGAADRQVGNSAAIGVQAAGGSEENVQTAASAGTTSGVPQGPKEGGDTCGIWNPSQCFMDIVLLLPGYIALTILQIAQWLTHISGMMLNYVVNYTVVNMKANMNNAEMLNDAWKTIRDVGNMGFIFILLYAAIKTIIGQGADNQKLVAKVVVVAILINFSLFFTKFVIDVSNVLAITFYDAIAPGALDSTFTKGISASLMEPLRLQSIFDVSSGLTIFSGEKIFIIGVAGTIFSLIAAFIFFAISLMFIIRFVVLIFVLILSPIAFLAFIMPQMKGYASQWWNALTGQAFFAPIFFLLTWIVITVSRSILKAGSFANLAGTSAPGGGTAPPPVDTIAMIVNFFIVIAMLGFSLAAAKSWSNKAGPGVTGATKWAMGLAGAASFGLASRASRYTIGAAAERFSDSKVYKGLERSAPTSRMARLALATADKTRKSSFDARAAGIGSLVGGQAGSAIGKGGFEADRKAYREFFEKPGTDAYKERQERARKAGTELDILNNREEVERVRRIDEIEKAARYSGVMTPEQSAELEKLSPKYRIERIEQEARDAGVMTPEQAAEIDKLTNKNKIERIEQEARDSGVMTPAQAAEIDKLRKEEAEKQNKEKAAAETFEKAITKASAKEIEAIVNENRKLLESQEFANKLNAQQLEALVKSDKFSESEKDALKNSRFKEINDAVDRGPVALDKIRPRIVSLKDAELEMLDPALLENIEFVSRLTPPQVEAITKSTRFTATQQNKVKELRRRPLLEAIDSTDKDAADKVRVEIRKLNPKDLAGMSWVKTPGGNEIITHPHVVDAYTKSILKKMGDTLSPENIQKVRDAIKTKAEAPGASKEIKELWRWLTKEGEQFFS